MRQHRMPPWKVALLFIIAVAELWLNVWSMTRGHAEEEIECWILCQPNSYVNARIFASGRSTIVGRLECGDKIYTDGVEKKGFLHCFANTESSDCWIHKGYIVFSEPHVPFIRDTQIISNGRVAARRTINGKRRCWLRDGQKIKVYMMSDEWAVTNKGFVKTEYIDQGK